VRLEGLSQIKNPITSLGDEPVTFGLAASQQFFSLALDAGEWPASRSYRFTRGTHWIGRFHYTIFSLILLFQLS
jgi:hypothetical protein